MASKFPKVETFATLSAEVAEYRKVIPMMQAQAQQAMMMAAAEKGKYLHVLKLFAALVAQNMQKGMDTVVLHKSIVDQPDTINISREPFPKDAAEDAQTGYIYRVISAEEIAALNDADSNSGVLPEPRTLLDAAGNPVVHGGESDDELAGAEADSAPAVEVPKAPRRKSRPVLRKEG